jgi:hypothetical protein
MPTDNPNSGSSGSSGAGATLTDLTKDLKSLQDNGPLNVKLSADAKENLSRSSAVS